MLWFALAIIILAPTYLVRFSLFGLPTTLLEILIYCSAIALLICQPIATTGQRLGRFGRRYGWPIALFILGALMATAISPDKRTALGLLKGYILDPILFSLVLVSILNTKERIYQAISAFLLSGILVAISAFLTQPNAEGRALGLYLLDVSPSPNYLALYLSPIASLAIGFYLTLKDKMLRWLSGITYILSMAALLAADSRGGLLAAGTATGLAIIYSLSRRLASAGRTVVYRIVTVVFILALLVFGWQQAKPDFSPTASARATTSNNLRYEIWRTTVIDILPKKAVAGVGLGNYQQYFTDLTADRPNFQSYIAPWARTPHNFFLTIWTNLGLLGLIGMIWLLCLVAADIRRSQVNLDISYALGLSLVGWLVHGLVDATYWKNDLSLFFWILIALAFSLRSVTAQERSTKKSEKGKENHGSA